jgi:hypothetical protein
MAKQADGLLANKHQVQKSKAQSSFDEELNKYL